MFIRDAQQCLRSPCRLSTPLLPILQRPRRNTEQPRELLLRQPGTRPRLGSLWNLPLGEYRVVYAFLSPAPMQALWAKAQREMKPGTILISNTFRIPGVVPELECPLPDRRDAHLLVYRL